MIWDAREAVRLGEGRLRNSTSEREKVAGRGEEDEVFFVKEDMGSWR